MCPPWPEHSGGTLRSNTHSHQATVQCGCITMDKNTLKGAAREEVLAMRSLSGQQVGEANPTAITDQSGK